MSEQQTQSEQSYDISVIRPQMRSEDFQIRGRQMKPEMRRVIEKDQADEHGHIERWKKMLESGPDR